MQDDGVDAQVELTAHRRRTRLGRARCRALKPRVGNETGDVLDLVGGRDLIDSPLMPPTTGSARNFWSTARSQ